MHSQTNLGCVAFNQRPFSYLFGQVRRLTDELRRRLNLSPAANRSVIKLLQTDSLRARHALGVMHFAQALRQKSETLRHAGRESRNLPGAARLYVPEDWQANLGHALIKARRPRRGSRGVTKDPLPLRFSVS
jgi:hypothetical protein